MGRRRLPDWVLCGMEHEDGTCNCCFLQCPRRKRRGAPYPCDESLREYSWLHQMAGRKEGK